MAQLVTVLEVIKSMGMQLTLVDELTDTITSAIEKATLRIESELGSPVRRGTALALFHPVSDLHLGVSPDGLLTLKADHLFLGAVTSCTVAPSLADTAVAHDLSEVIVIADKGLIKVPVEWDEQFIRLSYFFGFTDSTAVDTMVKQAILSIAPLIFRSTQMTTEASGASNGKESGALASGMFGKLLNRSGFTYPPVSTTTTFS